MSIRAWTLGKQRLQAGVAFARNRELSTKSTFANPLLIGDEIVVLEVRGEQVRLGIRAPKEVSVHRQEIYTQIHSEEESPPPADPK